MATITLNSVFNSDYFGGRFDENIKLNVNGQNVWDFKVQNGELRLIHEPLGVKETVAVKEIYKNYGMDAFDLPVVSETDSRELVEVEVISFKDRAETVNFKF